MKLAIISGFYPDFQSSNLCAPTIRKHIETKLSLVDRYTKPMRPSKNQTLEQCVSLW